MASALQKVLFWPDTHAPHCDNRAIQVVLDFAHDFKPDQIVFLGDFFDVSCVSSFEKDPSKEHRLLSDELAYGVSYLRQVDRAFPKAKITFIEGNHCARIKRYVFKGAPKLTNHIDAREVLGIPKKWGFIPYGNGAHYRIGNWIAIHGAVYNKHFAHSVVTKYGCNVIQGHVHRIQEHYLTKFNGEVLKAVSCGWLGDPTEADYVKDFPDWQQGFAVGYFKRSGEGFVQTIPIINHQAVVNGVLYKK